MTEVVRPGSYVSLFSGIGGLDLAVEAFFGYEPAAFCEIDPSCQRVLSRQWPGVPVFGDIRDFGAAAFADASSQRHGGREDGRGVGRMDGEDEGGARQRERSRALAGDRGASVDLVCGGFPCQDLSAAGKRTGFKGDRSSLFYELARVVDELGPRYVLLENVRGLLSATGAYSDERGAAMAEVTGTLADLGFTRIDWVMLGASDVGAPHRRHRIFILATHPDRAGRGEHERSVAVSSELDPAQRFGADASDPECMAGSTPRERDRRSRAGEEPTASGGEGETVGGVAGGAGFHWGAYEPAIRRWERVMGPAPVPVDEQKRLSADFVTWMMAFPPGWNEGETRTNRLKQLGNAVVWLQAYRALELLFNHAADEVIQST